MCHRIKTEDIHLTHAICFFQWRDLEEAVCHDEWPVEENWDPVLQTCIRKYPMKQLYYTFVCITLFFLPVAIMVTAYFLIIWRLWRTQAPGERNLANIHVQHKAKKKVRIKLFNKWIYLTWNFLRGYYVVLF